MRIDENMNIVITAKSDENGNALAHAFHTPISRETFEIFFRILSLSKTSIFGKSLQYAYTMGPTIATLTLKDESRRDAAERGEEDPEKLARSFLMEIRRLTMIIAPGPQGCVPIPVTTAISSGLIDEEDWSEVESALVFFTLALSGIKRSNRGKIMEACASILTGSLSSSTSTEWTASLPNSKAPAVLIQQDRSSIPC